MFQLSGFAASPDTSPEVVGAIGVGIGIVVGTLLGRFVPKQASLAVKNRLPPYQPGQTPALPSPNFGKNVHVYNPSELKSSYNLMISTVTPRPIALVSSRSKKSGVDNVSPFSYFGAVAHDPPMLAIGFCRKGRQARLQKDSLQNILERKEFCVNIMSEWYLEAANHSCGMWGPDVDEFVQSGMTKGPCVEVDAPRVKEAAVSYECKVEHVYPVTDDNGNPTTEIVIARVIRVHVDQEVLADHSDHESPVVDSSKLKPVGRLGGNTYCTIGEKIDMDRPSV
jgi:flavin reductase (DIM6/NTAB) family NADH-FMN oxidoreductase RutF